MNNTVHSSLGGQENKSCVLIPVNVTALQIVAEITILPVCHDRIRNGYVRHPLLALSNHISLLYLKEKTIKILISAIYCFRSSN